jgi:hypothetical protein
LDLSPGTGPPNPSGERVGVPDPTLLPVASGQLPNVAAYTALNVPSQPAGFSYNDPVTGVKVWKVTSSTVPASNRGAGHDYADGPNQVSRGWGPNHNTHTLLIRGDGMLYYLADFTRGVGFSNYRVLTVQPAWSVAASFSSVAGQERILYMMTPTQVIRYNAATMQVENTGYFPLTVPFTVGPGAYWLQQDKTDTWFVGLVNATTAFAWNSQTNQYWTKTVPWLNEPRLERDGRYVILTDTQETILLWDLSTNTLGPLQSALPGMFFHTADLRGHWIGINNLTTSPFAMDRYDPASGQITRTQILANSPGPAIHQAGNWIQSDVDLGGNLLKQWSFLTGFSPVGQWPGTLWTMAIGIMRSDGSDQRLLLHHYSANPTYWAIPFGMPSPDGKVVIFNSNMNASGRYDLFVAAMPLRAP